MNELKNKFKTLLVQSDLEETKYIQLFENQGFPNSKIEEWKGSPISKWLKKDYQNSVTAVLEKAELNSFFVDKTAENKLVFINGFFAENLSQIVDKAIRISSISELNSEMKKELEKKHADLEIDKESIFTQLNLAFSTQGKLIAIAKNSEVNISILNVSTNSQTADFQQIHNIFLLKENSQTAITNSYHAVGKSQSFSNSVNELFLEKNASVNYELLQQETENNVHINQTFVLQKAGSRFNSSTISLNGGFIRNELYISFIEEHCEAVANGLFLPNKDKHVDNFILINHLKAHCNSTQNYRGIIDNTASAIFTGKVYVEKDAQKTDAKQSNKNILLTDKARVDSRPQLEIYADDVSCAHGSTTGQLDEEALFYLQTRGLSRKSANNLLLYAFASDVVNQLKNNDLKEYISSELRIES